MQDHPGSRKKQPAAAAQAALPSSSSSSQDASNVKPKKRGRKPKNPLPEPTVTPPQQHDEFEDDDDFDDDHLEFDDIDEEDLPRDPRRRRTLERNRIAARKCRVRKRDEASALASREQAVEDQNRYLSTTYNSLTTEVYLLKTELLRHTHCNCKLIQEYIANEARRSVDKMNASPSSSQSHHLSTPTNLHNQTRRSSYFETEPGSFDGHSTLTEPVKNTWNNGFVPVDGTATPFQHVCNHQHSHQPVAQDGPHHDGSFGHIHHGHYGQPQCGVPGQFHDVAHGQMDTNVNMAGFNEQLNGQGFGPFFGSQTNFGPSFTKEQ